MKPARAGRRRWARRVLAGLGGTVLVLGLGVVGLVWWSLPPGHQVAAIPGLSAPVHVGIDADGIPRIEAATMRDGAAALGFVHARDRLFQMDLMRRAASGRLSEIAGGATLRLDRFNRTLGLRRRAEADLPGLDADTRAMLDAYAAGVNAWIAARSRFAAPEFVALGTPEPWTAVDSLLWGKTMALYLSGNWRQELSRAALRGAVPPDRLRALWPAQDPALPPDARLERAMTQLAAAVPAFPAPFTLPDTASNEWAVDAAHSTTGAPLLAGDPHLAYGMPGIWYLARIATPQGLLAGATAPGVPFLVMGHNGRIAWTFTTTGADTQDVFVETAAGDGYATSDGPRPFERREERIRVRGAPDDVLAIRETRHGPVLSDMLSDLDDPGGPILAVAMANLQPGDAAPGLLALNRAGTVTEARAAAARITAPVQNLLVADRTGIGQFTTGRVPVRRSGDGTMPVAGADGAADWTGFAQGDDLPHQQNPASGRLVNANEQVVPSRTFLGATWYGDWRARRIRALLDERTTYSVAGFAQMQVDAVSSFAQAVLPRLLRTPPADTASRTALAFLQRWDGAMRVDLSQPLLFNEWMRLFEAALLARDKLPPGALGAAPDAIARALGPAEAEWCGTDCDATLSRTLAAAAAGTARDAEWGEAHQALFQHPLLGRLPVLGALFTWPSPQAGDDTTLFRGSARAPDWSSVHGPSFRGVYDLADLDRSVFALAPGQSGHPFRRNAGSLLQRWRGASTLRLGPTAPAVESIELQP